MKFETQFKDLQTLWSQRNFAYSLAGLLAISNIILITALVGKEEQWVLIPQFDTEEKVPVSKSILSEAYLQKWASGVLQDLLTANPDSVDLKVHRFLEVATTSFGSLEEDLKGQAKQQKEEGFSTAFYPKDLDVRDGQVLVTGTLMTYFGRDKAPVVSHKKYKLGYKRAAHGVVLVTCLEEMK